MAWVAFCVFILGMLLFDLLLFNRKAHAVPLGEAALWSAVWIALGLGFAAVILLWGGTKPAGEYLAGYLIEKSLSMDNVFMFALIFSYFSVPAAYQHRALFLGIFGALLMRAAFIAGGAALLQEFRFVDYIFGAFLVVTGARLARNVHRKVDLDHNAALRLLRRTVPFSDGFRGARLLLREGGRIVATPMLAVVAAIEVTDLFFALDSIPAVFGVTRNPFLAFTSNAFAHPRAPRPLFPPRRHDRAPRLHEVGARGDLGLRGGQDARQGMVRGAYLGLPRGHRPHAQRGGGGVGPPAIPSIAAQLAAHRHLPTSAAAALSSTAAIPGAAPGLHLISTSAPRVMHWDGVTSLLTCPTRQTRTLPAHLAARLPCRVAAGLAPGHAGWLDAAGRLAAATTVRNVSTVGKAALPPCRAGTSAVHRSPQ
jgi:tellurite resistance protein TerC